MLSEEKTYDMILCDIMMPKMDGVAFLKELSKRDIHVPVLIVSSIAEKEGKETMEALELGAFDFVRKPERSVGSVFREFEASIIQRVYCACGLTRQSMEETIREIKIDPKLTKKSKKPCSVRRGDNLLVLSLIHILAMNPGYVEEEISGIPTFEPSFHLPAIWITESQRERAESLGYTVVDPPSIIATHLTEIIRTHLADLLTRQDVQNLINNVKDANETLISELVPKMLSVGEIEKVLQNLLAEGISIRDLVTIFETLADYATTTHDTDVLTEYVPVSYTHLNHGRVCRRLSRCWKGWRQIHSLLSLLHQMK